MAESQDDKTSDRRQALARKREFIGFVDSLVNAGYVKADQQRKILDAPRYNGVSTLSDEDVMAEKLKEVVEGGPNAEVVLERLNAFKGSAR